MAAARSTATDRSTGARAGRTRVIPGRRGRGAALLAGAGVLVVTLTGCGGANAEDAPVERKSFALEGKSLTIDSDNSRLEVVSADVRQVEVTRQADGWVFLGSGPKKSWKLKDGKLTLRFDCDAVASNCEGIHTVKVPLGVSVDVTSENGDVTASAFDTPLKVRSDNGNVTVRGTTAVLDLATENGDLTTNGVTATTLKASSQNGSVRIGLKAGAVAERIETANDNGNITIGLSPAGAPYAVTAETDNGSVKVDVPQDKAGSNVVTARSNNGNITVRSAK
jgi:hypothetical protein